MRFQLFTIPCQKSNSEDKLQKHMKRFQPLRPIFYIPIRSIIWFISQPKNPALEMQKTNPKNKEKKNGSMQNSNSTLQEEKELHYLTTPKINQILPVNRKQLPIWKTHFLKSINKWIKGRLHHLSKQRIFK